MPTNAERSAHTRSRLTAVARELFARQGFAGTSTEAILAGAGVQRGAMYHHFADKAALFEAVCQSICEEAVPAIDGATADVADPFEALVRGSVAWIAFMVQPEVRRILIVDAPTVLGWERWEALDRRLSFQSLKTGVDAALDAGAIRFDGNADMLTTMLNGALNAVALRVGAPGAEAAGDWASDVRALLQSLRPPARRR